MGSDGQQPVIPWPTPEAGLWHGQSRREIRVHYYETGPYGPIRWCTWTSPETDVREVYQEVDCARCVEKMARLILRRLDGIET